MVPGIKGYERFILRFIESGQALGFYEVCEDFISFLPPASAKVLDVGSGAGQNAAALAEMGYSVIAVEPMAEFLTAASSEYRELSVTWLSGSLPMLECLSTKEEQFDFIFAVGVWHHLNDTERTQATERFASLLKKGGKCALSLRNGPAGMGTCVHPIDVAITIEQFRESGLKCVLCLENKPSILSNKEKVIWARIVLQK